MQAKKENSNWISICIALGALVSVVILWGVSWYLIPQYFCCWEQRGQFGDMFGAINSLFSGLAFAGVIFTIWLQSRELGLQREDITQTRLTFQEQARTIEIQRFENTYFNMLTLLSSIQNGLYIKKTPTASSGHAAIEKHGRDVFVYFSESLQNELISPLPAASLETKIQNFIFNPPEEANIQLGYYFKTVYSILKFIETTQTLDLDEKKKYASMLRAQLSNDELFLLLCNSAYYKEFILFKLLLEKYTMLKHFYLRISIALTIDAPLRQEYQPRAFDKHGAFDISLYDSQLTAMGIQNFVTEN